MTCHFEPLAKKYKRDVVDLFNYYIEQSFAAYPETAVSYASFDIFLEMARGYPAVVVKTGTGEFAGFAFLHPFHPAISFNRTAEITCFIRPEHTRKGLGKTLLDYFHREALVMGVDNLLVNISSRNRQSLAFHRKHGFKECGRIRAAGRKFGKSFDVIWMQKKIT